MIKLDRQLDIRGRSCERVLACNTEPRRFDSTGFFFYNQSGNVLISNTANPVESIEPPEAWIERWITRSPHAGQESHWGDSQSGLTVGRDRQIFSREVGLVSVSNRSTSDKSLRTPLLFFFRIPLPWSSRMRKVLIGRRTRNLIMLSPIQNNLICASGSIGDSSLAATGSTFAEVEPTFLRRNGLCLSIGSLKKHVPKARQMDSGLTSKKSGSSPPTYSKIGIKSRKSPTLPLCLSVSRRQSRELVYSTNFSLFAPVTLEPRLPLNGLTETGATPARGFCRNPLTPLSTGLYTSASTQLDHSRQKTRVVFFCAP